MVELLAVELLDGLLFFREGEDIFALRPPYGSPVPAHEGVVARAISEFGFDELRQEFPSRQAMLKAFHQKTAEARAKAPGVDNPSEVLLRVAPPEILSQFLARIEGELLPKHKYEGAEALLAAMLRHARALKKDEALLTRTATMLEKAQKARQSHEREKTAPFKNRRISPEQFAELNRKGAYGEAQQRQQQVARRGLWGLSKANEAA